MEEATGIPATQQILFVGDSKFDDGDAVPAGHEVVSLVREAPEALGWAALTAFSAAITVHEQFNNGGWEQVAGNIKFREIVAWGVAGFLLIGDDAAAEATAMFICGEDAVEAGYRAFHGQSSSLLRVLFLSRVLHGAVPIELAFAKAHHATIPASFGHDLRSVESQSHDIEFERLWNHVEPSCRTQ